MGLYEVRRVMEAHVKLRAKLDFQIALNLGEARLRVTELVETIAYLNKYKTGSIIADPLGFVYRVNLIKKIFLASEVTKYSYETLRGILRMIHVKEERHKADLLAKLDLEISSLINFRELIMKAKFDGWRHEWRSALGEVANMASEYGMILNNFAEGYEAKFIEKTVNVIEDKLSRPMAKSGTERVQGLTLDMRMFNKEKSAQSTFYGHDSRKRQRETFSDESFLSSSHQTSSKRQHLTIFSWEWVHSHLKWPNEMDLDTHAFTKLDNLKLLRINYVQLNGSYDYFPENLRWLCWHGFPSTFLPCDLQLRNLVSLDLSYSNLEQVWKRTKLLGCLRILNLSYSRGLTKTPDFSGLPSLEKLLLKGCVTLVEICESIAMSEDLTLLDLEDCKNLINLPQTLWKLRYLETLVISGCSSLGEFPMDLRNMESLKELRADGSTFINPSVTIARKKKWWHPFVWSKPCRNPAVVWASLPGSLVKLHLANSNLSQDSFPKDFSNLSLLKHLNLSKNPIRGLPNAVRSLGKLEILDFTSCPHLQLLVDLPSSLEALWLDNCESLERVTSLNGLALSNLVKENCRKLTEVEGYFRLEPISKVNQEIINDLGLIDVGSMGNLELYLDDGFSYYNGKRPIQGLFQFGIFSTFIPSGEVPNWFEENKIRESSVSFTVPLDARFKCLNVCCVYGETDIDEVWSPHPAFIKVHNKTKNLTWIYCPVFFGLPDHEELAWLSQWNFGNHLECGNEATISFTVGDAFQVKECGVKLICFNQEDNQVEKEDDEIVGGDLLAFEETDEVVGGGDLQAFEEPDEVVGGDLQAFEFTKGTYFLFRDRFRHIIGMDDWTSTQWFRNLFGDSLDVLDALAGSWDGN
ncbi:hypothetical protein L6452_18329 [Arctium lappa]|uniref:Uncharacterized protein n=1 Tax=Arctium lappa TaxID=4217 RepID=A0ACB9C5V0_ARCLA|nr:hypothetical protein L6452_18329 [Arctium lappa]